MFSRAAVNSAVFRFCQFAVCLVCLSRRACTVVILDDMRLYMFSSFLLYTKRMLIAVMLARMSVEEIRRMVLILVLK